MVECYFMNKNVESSEAQQAGSVSTFWGDERKDLRAHNWLEHPVARQLINRRVSGDANVSTVEYWRDRFVLQPLPLACSIGCGFGAFERGALQGGLAQRFDACDVSEGAVAQARVYAAEAGLSDRVTYSVVDLNVDEMPEALYDGVFGISSIHHVFQLETVLRACRRALKPGGLLFLDEYIGPSRFQSSPKAQEIINRLLSALPSKYRRNVFLEGRPTETYFNQPISWFEQNDPSEAVRSAEIIPVLRYYFDVIDYRPYGGSILHMLLSGTAGNFDPKEESDIALLRTLAILEETLEECGVLQPDFAAIVARPKAI